MLKTIAAVVVNDIGQILPYTAQPNMGLCEERAMELFGEEMWHKMKVLGAHVAQCEIRVVD